MFHAVSFSHSIQWVREREDSGKKFYYMSTLIFQHFLDSLSEQHELFTLTLCKRGIERESYDHRVGMCWYIYMAYVGFKGTPVDGTSMESEEKNGPDSWCQYFLSNSHVLQVEFTFFPHHNGSFWIERALEKRGNVNERPLRILKSIQSRDIEWLDKSLWT